MDFKSVTRTLGGLLFALGLIVIIPGLNSLFHGRNTTAAFLIPGFSSCALGLLFWLSTKGYKAELNHRTGFAIVSFCWVSAAILGAFPYYLSATLPTFVDCLFESASGFTGTGASTIRNIEGTDNSLLLWRSLTQWLGGMGIIVFFLAILPLLGVGGVQLFRAEITGPDKTKIAPRVRDTAKKLWLLYLGYTAVATLLLMLCGMSAFDAVNHAFTTISTGGFSTKNYGIASFNSAAIEYVIIFFMILCSINFTLHYRLLVQRDKKALNSTELKWYLSFILLFVIMIYAESLGMQSEHAFRSALFTVAATTSSTGFTNYDYSLWSNFSQYLIVLMMIMGGMSGSTAGGVKCIRIVAAIKQLLNELKKVVHPRAVIKVKANSQPIPENIINAIWGFIFLYFLIVAVVAGVLVFDGLDILSAVSATFASISNIGPALGGLGPMSNYSQLPDLSKYMLIMAMILGRLELYTVLVLLTPTYWKK